MSRPVKPSANHAIDLGNGTDLNLSDDDDEDENEVVNEENQNEIIPHSNSEAENDDELNSTVRGYILSRFFFSTLLSLRIPIRYH